MPNPQIAAIEKVVEEREYQNLLWGTVAERPHEVGAWLTLIRARTIKAELAWSSADNDLAALEEIRKLAAVALACLEQHGCPGRSPAAMMAAKMAKHRRDQANGVST